MTMPHSLPTPQWLVCTGCGIEKPVEAFYRLSRNSAERARPCKTCKPDPTSSPESESGEADAEATRAAANTAAPLVAQALAVCEKADLDGPVLTLNDALICLIEDWGAET